MNPDKLIELIGHSVNHPDLQEVFKELNYATPVAIEHKYGLKTDHPFFADMGLAFEFTTQAGLVNNYAIAPKSTFTSEKYELMLREISFFDKGRNNVPYPFQLKFGDSYEETRAKIGAKHAEKRKAHPDGYGFYYYKDPLLILVRTDDDQNLESLAVSVMEKTDQKRIEQKNSLKQQAKSITLDNIDMIRKLTEALPTQAWKARMKEGDNNFTEKNIQASEIILKEFVDSILNAATEKKANKIMTAVKKAVVAFNKLKDKNDDFIDTMEREELVDFMIKTVELTGFKVNGADLTEEWREW